MRSLNAEEKEVGKDNYHEAVSVTRREFLVGGVLGTTAVSAAGLGAAYFKYEKVKDPVRIGVIGTGDEGNVLIGAINPNYVQVVAIADIRPYNIHRAFHGDWGGGDPNLTHSIRTGLIEKYGWNSEEEARKHVKVYDKDYHDLIKDSDVEAVIIALPLHLHALVSIECLKAGKHVLTEKLMAHNVAQCKVMARVAEQTGLCLATGHQRHYSILYDNAVNLIQWGVLGQIHHIRAQWHRNNMPGNDSWQPPLPGGEMAWVDGQKKNVDRIQDQLKGFQNALNNADPATAALLHKKIAQWKAWDRDRTLKAEDYDYREETLSNGRLRTAMEELVRWRIWDRTGGGLMAELGSHQLDASSIFCSALRKDGKKAHPLTVHALGGRHIFPLDRDAEDHVYCMFEFPGPEYDPNFDVGYYDRVSNTPDPKEGVPSYEKDRNKKIVVSYSSINGNDFGGYGEVVMGTKGTLILEREQEVMLYKSSDTSTRISVKGDKGAAVIDTQSSGRPTAALSKAVESTGPVSKGYTEEIEHWAYCIRNKSPEALRCRPEVAMGDAVIALTTNVAIKKSMNSEPGFVQFKESWFDVHSDETPDGSSVESERNTLGA
jgi:predicted dehydrogenase